MVIGGMAIYYDIQELREKRNIWSGVKKGDVFLSIVRYESPFKPTEITPIVILDTQDNWIQYKWPDGTISDCRYESFFEFWGFISLETYNEKNAIKYHYNPELKPKTTGDLFLK